TSRGLRTAPGSRCRSLRSGRESAPPDRAGDRSAGWSSLQSHLGPPSPRLVRRSGIHLPETARQDVARWESAAFRRDGATLEDPVPSVLMVDDRPQNLLALEGILKPLGARLVKAKSGEEALLHLLRETFAVILLDVQMPRLDGLQTAELIKQREQTRHVPIIFITALSREAAYVFKGYASGAVDYLLKPIDPELVRAKVRVFCDLFVRGEKIRQQTLRSETKNV